MPWIIGGAVLGSAVIGSVMQSNAAGDASDAQVGSANAATGEQARQYNQTRADYAPYREAGSEALTSIRDMLRPGSSFSAQSPDYAFRMGEGEKAINRAAAAHGRFDSPRTIKDLLRFNSGLASEEFGNTFNRRAAVAGIGQTATGGTATAGMNAANSTSDALIGAGNARASGYLGSAGAWSSGLNSVANMWNQNQMLDRLTASPYSFRGSYRADPNGYPGW